MAVLTVIEEAVRFPAGDLRLEGVFAYPAEGAPVSRVLLLAPHPHMGGNMENNLVRHLARRAAEDGAASLRFNYRGVGGSEIHLPPDVALFDHWSAMEQEQRYEEILPDALHAMRALARLAPDALPMYVVGYSLGAILGGMALDHIPERLPVPAVSRIAAIAPPTKRVSVSVYGRVAVPKLFVAGDRDFAFDRARFTGEFAGMAGEKTFVELPGADHFFRSEEERVYEALMQFLGGHDAEPASLTPPGR